MKHLILFLILLLPGVSVCLAAEEFNFRGVTWGMTKEQVAMVETGQEVNTYGAMHDPQYPEYIIPEKIYGFNNVTVSYELASKNTKGLWRLYAGGVVGCNYIFPTYDVYDKGVAIDFERLVAEIAKEYGPPQFFHAHKPIDAISPCDEYLELIGNYGTEYGWTFCYARWQTQTCNIEAGVGVHDMSCVIHMGVSYMPPGFPFLHHEID